MTSSSGWTCGRQVSLALLLVGMAAPLLPGAEEKDSRAARVDELFSSWDRNDTPGAAVAVVEKGLALYQNGYGTAQLEYGVPITTSTLFQVASVSKQFTAASILALVQQGKLSLQEDIRSRMPELPDFGTPITPAHLLYHTSGLRDQWDLLAIAGWRPDDVITQQQILELISRQRDLNFAPGSQHLSSDTGYTLLAEVVERVSGQPLDEFVRRNFFEPLGMKDSRFQRSQADIIPNRAYSYGPGAEGGFQNRVSSYATWGATGLFTSVEDLSRWAANLKTGKVGGKELFEVLFARGALDDGRLLDHAAGLVHSSYRGQEILEQGGADAGFRSHFLYLPKRDLSVILLSNREDCNAAELARKTLDIFLPEGAGRLGQEEAKPSVPWEVLTALTGTYRTDAEQLVEVSLRGSSLLMDAEGEPRVQLQPLGGTRFEIQEIRGTVRFQEPAGAESKGFTLLRGEAELKAVRLAMARYDPEQLAAFTGDYYCPELRMQARLAIRDGQLVLEHPRHPEVPLRPLHEDSFTSSRWWLRRLRFYRFGEAIEGFTITSNRVWNLRFRKVTGLE